MSIATELTNYKTYLTNAYNKCADKGAIIPTDRNMQNMTNCIDSINQYTRLLYLESTGTQYIDTGFKPNQNSGIDIAIDTTNCVNMDYPSPFGSRGNGTTGDTNIDSFTIGIHYPNNASTRNWWFKYGTISVFTDTTYGNKYGFNQCVIDKNKYTINGKTYTFEAQTFQSINNMFLFGYNYNGSLGIDEGGKFKGKIFYAKIYDNGTLVRDFIPVLDKNNVPCLYDKLNNTFYYNQGTGNFIAGDKILNYIKSTGTQYIDTGYKHNNNTRMVADIDFQPTGRYQTPFGSWGNNRSNKIAMMGSETPNASPITSTTCYYGNMQSWSVSSSVWQKRTIWDWNKNVYKIGESTKTFTARTFQSLYNDLIFAKTGYEGELTGKTTMKLYSFKIYDNDILVRDYIPVLTPSNVPCLYDKVSNTYYTNAGTGNFLYG